MANFVLRLLKRKVVDKTLRRRPGRKQDASSDDDDGDDEGFIESKFDYDEGVTTYADSIINTHSQLTSNDHVDEVLTFFHNASGALRRGSVWYGTARRRFRSGCTNLS